MQVVPSQWLTARGARLQGSRCELVVCIPFPPPKNTPTTTEARVTKEPHPVRHAMGAQPNTCHQVQWPPQQIRSHHLTAMPPRWDPQLLHSTVHPCFQVGRSNHAPAEEACRQQQRGCGCQGVPKCQMFPLAPTALGPSVHKSLCARRNASVGVILQGHLRNQAVTSQRMVVMRQA